VPYPSLCTAVACGQRSETYRRSFKWSKLITAPPIGPSPVDWVFTQCPLSDGGEAALRGMDGFSDELAAAPVMSDEPIAHLNHPSPGVAG